MASTEKTLTVEHFAIGPMDNNLYLLIDHAARAFVVIDPSIESEVALKRAQELVAEGFDLLAIWNTHGHFDHILDNEKWKNAFSVPLLMHKGDLFFVERLKDQALWFGFPASDGLLPDENFHDGQTLKIGPQSVQILHTPGHSPGSVSFYLKEQEICLSGDVIFKGGVGRTDLPGCSDEQLGASLQLLLSLPETTQLLPGHGPSTTVAHEKRTNPVYLSLPSAP